MLVFHVDGFIVIFRVDRDRQIKLLWIGPGKSGITIWTPLHRRAATIAIAKIEIVPHANLISVVDDGGAGHREEQRVK